MSSIPNKALDKKQTSTSTPTMENASNGEQSKSPVSPGQSYSSNAVNQTQNSSSQESDVKTGRLDEQAEEDLIMQKARETIKDKLEKKPEVTDMGNGQFKHRSHVVLITMVDGVPLATYLVLNVKSTNKEAKVAVQDILFEGRKLELKRDGI